MVTVDADANRDIITRALVERAVLGLHREYFVPSERQTRAAEDEYATLTASGQVKLYRASLYIYGEVADLYRLSVLGPGGGTIGSPRLYVGPRGQVSMIVIGKAAADSSIRNAPLQPFRVSFAVFTKGRDAWFLDQGLRELRSVYIVAGINVIGDGPVCTIASDKR